MGKTYDLWSLVVLFLRTLPHRGMILSRQKDWRDKYEPGLKYCMVVISTFALIGTVFLPIISDKIIARDSLDFNLYTNYWQYSLISGWSCLSPSEGFYSMFRSWIWNFYLWWPCVLFNPSWQPMNEFTWVGLGCLGCSQVCFKPETTWVGFEVLQSAWDSNGIPPSAKRRALAPGTSWRRGSALGSLLWCKQRHSLKCWRNHPPARSPVSVASIVVCCLHLGSSSHRVCVWL